MLNASTKKHSLTFENSNIGLKNYYLKTVFKNNLEDVIIYLVFNFKLLKKKYYVCNCLFDGCLESIPLQEKSLRAMYVHSFQLNFQYCYDKQ